MARKRKKYPTQRRRKRRPKKKLYPTITEFQNGIIEEYKYSSEYEVMTPPGVTSTIEMLDFLRRPLGNIENEFGEIDEENSRLSDDAKFFEIQLKGSDDKKLFRMDGEQAFGKHDSLEDLVTVNGKRLGLTRIDNKGTSHLEIRDEEGKKRFNNQGQFSDEYQEIKYFKTGDGLIRCVAKEDGDTFTADLGSVYAIIAREFDIGTWRVIDKDGKLLFSDETKNADGLNLPDLEDRASEYFDPLGFVKVEQEYALMYRKSKGQIRLKDIKGNILFPNVFFNTIPRFMEASGESLVCLQYKDKRCAWSNKNGEMRFGGKKATTLNPEEIEGKWFALGREEEQGPWRTYGFNGKVLDLFGGEKADLREFQIKNRKAFKTYHMFNRRENDAPRKIIQDIGGRKVILAQDETGLEGYFDHEGNHLFGGIHEGMDDIIRLDIHRRFSIREAEFDSTYILRAKKDDRWVYYDIKGDIKFDGMDADLSNYLNDADRTAFIVTGTENKKRGLVFFDIDRPKKTQSAEEVAETSQKTGLVTLDGDWLYGGLHHRYAKIDDENIQKWKESEEDEKIGFTAYDEVISNGLVVAQHDDGGKWACYDADGEKVFGGDHKDVIRFVYTNKEKFLMAVDLEDKIVYLDRSGEVKFGGRRFDKPVKLSSWEQGLAAVIEDDGQEYIDQDGNSLFGGRKAQIVEMTTIKGLDAIVAKENENADYDFYDREGNKIDAFGGPKKRFERIEVIRLNTHPPRRVSYKLALAQGEDRLWAFYDEDGEKRYGEGFLELPKMMHVRGKDPFMSGRLPDGTHAFVTMDSELLYGGRFKRIEEGFNPRSSRYLCGQKDDDTWGFYDIDGNVIYGEGFKEFGKRLRVTEGIAISGKKNGLWRVYSESGEIIFDNGKGFKEIKKRVSVEECIIEVVNKNGLLEHVHEDGRSLYGEGIEIIPQKDADMAYVTREIEGEERVAIVDREQNIRYGGTFQQIGTLSLGLRDIRFEDGIPDRGTSAHHSNGESVFEIDGVKVILAQRKYKGPWGCYAEDGSILFGGFIEGKTSFTEDADQVLSETPSLHARFANIDGITFEDITEFRESSYGAKKQRDELYSAALQHLRSGHAPDNLPVEVLEALRSRDLSIFKEDIQVVIDYVGAVAEDRSLEEAFTEIMEVHEDLDEKVSVCDVAEACVRLQTDGDRDDFLRILREHIQETRDPNSGIESYDYSDLIDCAVVKTAKYKIIKKLGSGAIKVAYLGARKDMDYTQALLVIDPQSHGYKFLRHLHPEWSDEKIKKKIIETEFSAIKIRKMAEQSYNKGRFIATIGLPVDGTIRGEECKIIPTKQYKETLDDVIKRANLEGNKIEPDRAFEFMWQISYALVNCHEYVDEERKPRPIVHKDLKPDNIGLSFDGKIQLADFGNTSMFSTHAKGQYQNPLGLRPPELAKTDEELKKDNKLISDLFNCETNVWSAGMIFYQIMTGESMFERPVKRAEAGTELYHEQNVDMYQKIQEFVQYREDYMFDFRQVVMQRYDAETADLAYKVLDKCLQPKPEDRKGALNEVRDMLEEHLKFR